MIHLFSQLFHSPIVYACINPILYTGTNPYMAHPIHKNRRNTAHAISLLFESDCIIPYSYLTYKSSDKSYQNFNISANRDFCFVRYLPFSSVLLEKILAYP